MLAANNGMSDFSECYNEESAACNNVEDLWQQSACLSAAYSKCQGEGTLVDDFGCAEGLTNEECLDLYTIALFNGKLSAETILMRLQNRSAFEGFLKVLNTVKTEIHHGEHKESPVTEDGSEWDYSMSSDPLAVRMFLEDATNMQK